MEALLGNPKRARASLLYGAHTVQYACCARLSKQGQIRHTWLLCQLQMSSHVPNLCQKAVDSPDLVFNTVLLHPLHSAMTAEAAVVGASMVLYFMLTSLGLLLFLISVGGLVWMIRSGQTDDLDTPALRMLADDTPAPPSSTTPTSTTDSKERHCD